MKYHFQSKEEFEKVRKVVSNEVRSWIGSLDPECLENYHNCNHDTANRAMDFLNDISNDIKEYIKRHSIISGRK